MRSADVRSAATRARGVPCRTVATSAVRSARVDFDESRLQVRRATEFARVDRTASGATIVFMQRDAAVLRGELELTTKSVYEVTADLVGFFCGAAPGRLGKGEAGRGMPRLPGKDLLPAPDRDVDVFRRDLEAVRSPADLFRSENCRARSREWVEHELGEIDRAQEARAVSG